MTFKCFSVYFLIAISICSCLVGCSTIPKTIYFQGDTSRVVQIEKVIPKSFSINSNDILAITVTSISEEINKLYELPIAGGLRFSGLPNVQSNSMGMQPLGYEVDSLGYVELPLIGKVLVKNLTLSVASDTIKNKLNKFIKNPSVNTRILNHKFTILGEVNRPATYNLLDNRTSIIEAIGIAGDLTIYGNRSNISLIRNDRDSRKIIRLNLLSKDILISPYYYLQDGDIIYVEPSEVKSTYNDRSYQMIPIVTSIVAAVTSLGVLILSLTR